SPVSEAGQYVSLRAEMDLVIVFSACPQDMVPVNDMRPTDAHFLIA
ncbi:MAG TPA: aminomethyltransferase, partial [Bradyrhizobium sp.]|nr:aminomethyltransferase [Bradyrhizobium sp.]